MGLDGPELEPDEGLEGPGEKLRRLAGDGGDPALPRPRLYVSESLSHLAWALPSLPRPRWLGLRLREGLKTRIPRVGGWGWGGSLPGGVGIIIGALKDGKEFNRQTVPSFFISLMYLNLGSPFGTNRLLSKKFQLWA